MKKSMKEKHKEILDSGQFFDHFPTLTGVWSQDKKDFPDLFEIKKIEMTVEAQKLLQESEAPNPFRKGSPFPLPVMRDDKGNLVEPKISEKILNRPKFSANKIRIIQIKVQQILLDLELYNLECEKGFEISLDELIAHYKSTKKKA